MKESKKEEEQDFSNLFGGYIRYIIAKLGASILKKEKPIRTSFTVPTDAELDWEGFSNTSFKNTLTTIIAGFIILSAILITIKNLF